MNISKELFLRAENELVLAYVLDLLLILKLHLPATQDIQETSGYLAGPLYEGSRGKVAQWEECKPRPEWAATPSRNEP